MDQPGINQAQHGKFSVLYLFFYLNREDKKIKIEQLKKYLADTHIIIGTPNEAQLEITEVKSMSGEASIAVIRSEPRMGYELSFKVELTGCKGTYLEGLKCEVEVEEMCDD